MTDVATIARKLFFGALPRLSGMLFLLALILNSANAQNSSTDGSTPLGLAPGAPAGSYALSGFDNINLFNGNLNFSLPLLHVGGRGEAQYTVTLPIERHWRVDHSIITSADGRQFFDVYTPDSNWWSSTPAIGEPHHGPGVLEGRQVGNPSGICDTLFRPTLTRLTFTAPDGTEYELRDQLNEGKPIFAALVNQCNTTDVSRGITFVTADGTAATFVSDAVIYDDQGSGAGVEYPSGYLMLRNGTAFRIDSGVVTWMRDRNGNRLSFTYDLFKRVTTITDSINRLVTITYADGTTPYDQITFKGFGGATRTIRVWHTNLGNALRQGYVVQTFRSLFPELNGASSSTFYNPTVTSAVELPDGRRYQFFYNSYGELARVVLPTGGAIEYDYGAGIPGGAASGVTQRTTVNTDRQYQIYRRVAERRVYPDGVTLEGKMTYTNVEYTDAALSSLTSVVADHLSSNGSLLSREKHYFYGWASNSLFQGPLEYQAWKDGKEYQSEAFDASGITVLRRVADTWQQRAPVSWYTGPADGEPPNDPRIIEADSALVDTNQVAKQTFSYDQYNNKTDVYEYEFGAGTAGPLLRRAHTDYLTTNPVNGANYAANTDIHLRSLPVQQSVFDVSGIERARTTFEYDNYTAGLTNRFNISGLDSAFTTGYLTRGNVTAITRWLLPATQLTARNQYDIAGNVVSSTDPKGNQSTFDYSDRFGAPDGDARFNSAPVELAGQVSFAFATSVTNALGHTSFAQYDYYIGRPVDTEDANGVVVSASYNDLLDRPTQLTRAVGTTIQSRTLFSYNDAGRIVTTSSDLNTYLDNQLKGEAVYDGLGRTTETRKYESAFAYVTTTQSYDGMGRVSQVSNPYRPASEGPVRTTTQYDALSRIVSVTAVDGAVVRTDYSGNSTTVTDQAGKARRSVTDAAGRLVQVIEDPLGLGYVTTYSYDALDDLTNVAQGGQSRSFGYDSLKRLTSGINPESGTVSYQYDNNGNLTSKTDARGITTSFIYDSLNRVTSRSYSDTTPAVSYGYDATTVLNSKGRLTSVSSSVSSYSYGEYDALSRVRTGTQTTSGQSYTMTYAYDLAGNITSETYPSGRVVTTSYDSAGRLSAVNGQKAGEAAKTYASSFSYTAHGAVGSMTLGNNLVEHTNFNSRLQPTQIGLGTSSIDSSKLQLDYSFGTATNNGNVQSQTITIGTTVISQSYGYDGLNRLSSASENSGASWSQTYSYDQFGNRAVSGYVPSALTPQSLTAFNASNNRLVGSTYDAAGNQTIDSAGSTFGYDAEKRQITSNVGGVSAGYSYDGDGHRVKKIVGATTTVMVYNVSGQLIAEYADPSPSSQGGTSYLTSDHLGSTRVVTKQDGSVKARYDYLPFGEELPSTVGGRSSVGGYGSADSTRQKFTQKERDNESGLDYFGERYYSSAQGRFTTVDPVMMSARTTDPQSWNRFVYVLNNPLRYVDPDGLEEKTAWDQLTSEEKRALAPKLVFVMNSKKLTALDLNAAGKAFNKAFTGGNAKETSAMVAAVKNFIDNAGGHSNSEVWQHITTIDGGWAGKNDSAGIRFHVDDKKGFLDVLSRNGYSVDSFDEHFNIMASHEHSARFITERSYDTAMHLVSEKGADTRLFFAHWDPRSTAYRHGSMEYFSYGPFRDVVEKSAAGLAHDNYRSATETRERLRRQGIVPTKEP